MATVLTATMYSRFLRFIEFLFQGEFKPNFLGLLPLVEQVKIVANVATLGNKFAFRSLKHQQYGFRPPKGETTRFFTNTLSVIKEVL
jgi:hypothetical protein